jgi:dienelactone hydrolase
MNPSAELREFLFRYDRRAPLHVANGGQDTRGAATRERFSFASINDHRVPTLLTYNPDTPAPRPVLIIQHGLHSSKDDTRLAELAAAWAVHGFACVTIDAPLHGERADGELDVMQLLSRPYTGLRFVVQNVVDLRRAVDLCEQRPDLDDRRIAYVGFSMSAFLGVQFVALEPRVRAACLALGGAGLFHFFAGQVEAATRPDLELVANLVDPLHFAPLIAPRPVLQVNSETDQIVPAALGHMLHGALREPKRMIWFHGAHGQFPDDVLAEMRLFLSDALDSAKAPSPVPSPAAAREGGTG